MQAVKSLAWLLAWLLRCAAKEHPLNGDHTWSPSTLPERPMLVFVHLEKSAGSYLGNVMPQAVGRQNYLGYHLTGVPIFNVRQEYFLVSSIRNPCTQVVSQWAYCCEKAWAWETLGHFDAAAQCGSKLMSLGYCPSYSGNKTKMKYTLQVESYNRAGFMETFQETANGFASLYEQQFNGTFRAIGPERVDCWIRFENLHEDTDTCLRKYEERTGVRADLSFGRAPHNQGFHNLCKKYYCLQTRQVVKRANAFLRKYFGYTSCCDH